MSETTNKKMGCFLLRLLASRRILLVAGLGSLFAVLELQPQPRLLGSVTVSSPMDFPSSSSASNAWILPPVGALPPRIRPKRQSAAIVSDEVAYGGSIGSGGSKTVSGSGSSIKTGGSNGKIADHQLYDSISSNNKHEQALEDPSLLTGISFADRTDLHPDTKEALRDTINGFGLQTMTVVQAATYAAALEGRSILARSKTGSGKTLAFLLPVLERLLDQESDAGHAFVPGRSIGCVVLAPTRELAIQIADQADILVGYHNKHRNSKKPLSVACIYGGVKMQRDVRLLTGDHQGGGLGYLPTILVSTPSRLLQHLEGNSPLHKGKNAAKSNSNIIIQQSRKSKNKFAGVVAETKIVVLDETDRLLQKSNQQETQRILGFLARPDKRQTLLFSATFPRAVRRLLSNSSIMTKKKQQQPSGSSSGSSGSSGTSISGGSDDRSADFLEVDCIRTEEMKAKTTPQRESDGNGSSRHSADSGPEKDTKASSVSVNVNQNRIQESFVVLENMLQFIPSLLTIIRREQQRDDQNYKILVFFPAGRLVRFLFQFFTTGALESKEHLWEIHSRMSQSSRTRASNSFRSAKKGVLFSSDVSARGLDYPDVSLVVQMGAPSNDQDYVHRIGRTGRAGKSGRSLLVLLPFEKRPEPNSNERGKPKRYASHKRRRSSSTTGTVGYRKDANLEEDRQLASWLKWTDAEESLYRTCKEDLEPIRRKVRSGHVVLTPGAEASYKTFLAHYVATAPSDRKTNKGRGSANAKNQNKLSPSEVLAYAKDFVEGTGLTQPPALDEEFASKLGLEQQQQQ